MESITFNEGDLLYALHNAKLKVKGIQNDSSKWDLEIVITDTYDFTDLVELPKYIKKGNIIEGIALATGNNLAIVATSCKVIHKFDVTIKILIKDWSE